MAETKNYVFSHTELAEILVKQLNLMEGLWGIYLEFGVGGANVPTSPDGKTLTPAAIAFINKIGLQRFEQPTNLTVDAAAVNPASPTAKHKHLPSKRRR